MNFFTLTARAIDFESQVADGSFSLSGCKNRPGIIVEVDKLVV